MKQGSIKKFMNLSQFRDITDFNNHIEQWMIDIKRKFTKSELVALKRLIRFSAKVVGVCNAKIGTLVSATHEKDGAGISRSTFKRMVLKANELGLLLVNETERKNGSQSSNVYVFNRFVSAEVSVESSVGTSLEWCSEASFKSPVEPPKDEKLNHQETNNLLETNNHLKTRTNNENSHIVNNVELGKEFISKDVPEDFVKLASCYYGSFEVIEEFWKMVEIAEREAGYEVAEFDLLDVSLDALKETVKALKLRQVRKNVFAFFYGTMKKMLKELKAEYPTPENEGSIFVRFIPVSIKKALAPIIHTELDEMGVF